MSELHELPPAEIRPLPPALNAEGMQMVALAVKELMGPVMESIGKMLENNTQAIDQIAAAQQMTSDRIDALEKQLRLNTPMNPKQVQYLNDAIRARSRELLEKRGYADDKKAVTKLGNAIRKSVLARYGVGNLREIPKCEYTVTMSQIERWNNSLTVLDVVKEARRRAGTLMESAEPTADLDVSTQDERTDDKPRKRAVRSSAAIAPEVKEV